MTIPNVSPAGSGVPRGILWMLVTTFFFVCLDTLAKHLNQSYPVVQVVWARYLFHGLLLALYLNRRLPQAARSNRRGLQLWRSIFMLGATALFFTAISIIPLAQAAAIMFLAPLIVTGLSMPLLGERVGPRRWAGVLVGFIGALIIVRPGGDAVDPAAFLVLGAACCYALYQITTRKLAGLDPPLTTLGYSTVAGILATNAAVPFVWVTPDLAGWLAMIGMGLAAGLGHFALIKAFESAPAATISPLGYSSLIWATLFGFAVFGELPDRWTVVGALIIAGSGLYIAHRERVRRAADSA